MLRAQRFWSKELRNKVEDANKAIKTKNFTELDEILNNLLTSLKDSRVDWKDRVAICFILEQMAAFNQLTEKIVQTLLNVLESEKDPHVREFAIWAMGKIVEGSESLDLIKRTMPVIVKSLTDDSEQVKNLAKELQTRFEGYIKEKQGIDDQIQSCRAQIKTIIDQKLEDMRIRSDLVSKEALGLNYQTAFAKQDEMKLKIKQFNEENQKLEDQIVKLENELIVKLPAFKGEDADLIRYWREKRGEKEDLVRRIECIIRIQSKIYNIIRFILSIQPNQKVDLSQITEITKATGRPYSEKEVVEILKQLVDEEIIPNFMLEQIKDYQVKKEVLEKGENLPPEKPAELPVVPPPSTSSKKPAEKPKESKSKTTSKPKK